MTMKSPARAGRFALLWLLCPVIALASYRFLIGGVAMTMPDFLYHADLRPLAFYAHIILAPVALALVPFQLSAEFRRKRLETHRTLGRVYVVAVLLSGLSGLWLAFTTRSGDVAAWGFGLLSLAWIGTTVHGLLLAIQGDLAAHRRWMIRSTALTMAAVTLRLYLGLAVAAGFSYQDIVAALAWSCWVPNLLAAEFILRRAGTAAALRAATLSRSAQPWP
jgi:uncharacterized membrane protein